MLISTRVVSLGLWHYKCIATSIVYREYSAYVENVNTNFLHAGGENYGLNSSSEMMGSI
jgi:hypothetical protein